jgi:hypothetical protein
VGEWEGKPWKYSSDFIPGALRLVAVEPLLRSGLSEIHLYEFDGLSLYSLGTTSTSSYACISHVWEASLEVQRISRHENRPLGIYLSDSEPNHTISWHGLTQAARGAKWALCDWLWLDLLCLNQANKGDKNLQIKKMERVYGAARATLVMFGGVAAAQPIDKTASWIDRAWTMQEAVSSKAYGLVEWNYPDSFVPHNPDSIRFTQLEGNIAVVDLLEILVLAQETTLGKTNRLKIPGTRGRKDIETDLPPVKCLGSQPRAVSALVTILHNKKYIADVPIATRDSAIWRGLWIRTSKKPHDMVYSSMSVFGEEIEVNYDQPAEEVLFELVSRFDSKARFVSYSPQWLCIGHNIPVNPRSGLLPLQPTFKPHSAPIYEIAGTEYSAAQLLCDCCKDLRLTIAVRKTSKTFGHIVCSKIMTATHYFDLKNSSSAWLRECQLHLSGPSDGAENYDQFYDAANLKCSWDLDNNVIGTARCEFDGELGPYVVVVGYQRENLADWTESKEPLVFFMQQNHAGTWQKVGTGKLFAVRDYFPLDAVTYTHLHVGGDTPTGGTVPCNCDELWRMRYGMV